MRYLLLMLVLALALVLVSCNGDEGARTTTAAPTTSTTSESSAGTSSDGSEAAVEMPDVVQLTLDQATALAESQGLQVEVTEEIPTFDNQPDIVLLQEPVPGEAASDGKIYLTVSREPIRVQVDYLQDYDPGGNNGRENPEQVPNLIDNKERTTWSTEKYELANLDGLKPGVGLRFTLAEEATLLKIVSTTSNWQGEVQTTTPFGTMVPVATLGDRELVTLQQPIMEGVIWITSLGLLPDNDRYGVQIAEIAFYK
jgi:hypothetical protein